MQDQLQDHGLDERPLQSLWRLAWPTTLASLLQIVNSAVGVFYIGYLGTASLAGAALVFPLQVLMVTIAAGGFGGGVGSAIARALGGGRVDDAQELLWHAVLIAVVAGSVFMLAVWFGGPALFSAMGQQGSVIEAALSYSRYLFAGAVPLWISTLLMAALRGSGDAHLPARVATIGVFVVLALSPLLIFGMGPLPGLGVAGAGLASTIFYVGASVFLLRVLLKGRNRLRLQHARLRRSAIQDILKVALPSSFGSLQGSLNTVLIAAAVSRFGGQALAAYGVASRVDYLLNTLLFGLGSAMVATIGAQVGAGRNDRARQLAWAGAALAASVTGLVGLILCLFPAVWLRWFSKDPSVLAHGAAYFHIVGPAYALNGLGLALYYARQGMGRAFLPFLASMMALITAAGGGWLAVGVFHVDLVTLFWIIAASRAVYAGVNLATMIQMNRSRESQSRRSA